MSDTDRTEKVLVEEVEALRQRVVEQERLIYELRAALAGVKKLSGLLPICSCCKKIRNEDGEWEQMELYIREHSEADFSHGLCPECGEKTYVRFVSQKTDRPRDRSVGRVLENDG